MRMAEVLRRVGITARDPDPEYQRVVRAVERLFDDKPGSGNHREFSARDVEVVEMWCALAEWGWITRGGVAGQSEAVLASDRVLAWVRENGWPDEPTAIQNEGGCTIWIPARSWWQPQMVAS